MTAQPLAESTAHEAQPPAVPSQASSLLTQIIAAATNPEVDAAKMVAMAELATRLQDREHQQMFARDFAAAVMDMPRISKQNRILIPGKDGQAGREQGKFASWENIDKVIRPILAKNNLVLTFDIGSDQGITCIPILTHRLTGYVRRGEAMRVPPDTSGSKNAAQAVGSSVSYAKRYAGCAMLNIVTEGEDRDGTNYPLATDELNDRQQRIVNEAYASHKDGNFAVWWDRLSAKDRELLVVRGVYAELTGAPALPGGRTLDSETAGEISDSARPRTDSPPATDDGPTGPKGRTADQMVDDYIARVDACETTEALMKIQEDPKTINWLGKLSQKDSSLFERATVASSKRYAELMAKEDGGQQSDERRLV